MRANPNAGPSIEISDDSDFGKIVSENPKDRIVFSTAESLSENLKRSSSAASKLTYRGCGHSVFGQTVTSQTLIQNNADPSDIKWLDDHLIDVPSGMTWFELEHLLHPKGRESVVTPDYLHMTIGGMLSVGGIGRTSIKHGTQVDNVHSLILILPDGSRRLCSPDSNPEFFHAALCGMGQIGFIERVVMKTVEHSPAAQVASYFHDDMKCFLKTLERVIQLPTGERPCGFRAKSNRDGTVHAQWHHRVLTLDLGHFFSQYDPFGDMKIKSNHNLQLNIRDNDHQEVIQWVNSKPNTYRMWTDYIFDFEGMLKFLEFVSLPKFKDFWDHLDGIMWWLSDDLDGKPAQGLFNPVAIGKKGPYVDIGFYFMVDQNRPEGVTRILDIQKQFLEKLVAIGGRPYLYGSNPMSESLMQQIYGEDYYKFIQVRNAADPHGRIRRSF